MQVFISYEHTSYEYTLELARLLEENGYTCWYAPRNVHGDYASSIVSGINGSQIFILLVNEASSRSVHVLNEVEIAYQKLITGELQIYPVKLDESLITGAMEYYIKRLHWLEAIDMPAASVAERTFAFLRGAIGAQDEEKSYCFDNTQREQNVQYLTCDDLIEKKRLSMEGELLYEYEKPVLDKMLEGKSDLTVLDYYRLDARAAVKLLNRPEFSKVMAFSYLEEIAVEGNLLSPDSDKMRFFAYGDQPRDLVIEEKMKEMGIKGFDLVVISLAIMDMKNPFKELKKLKRFMNPGAQILVVEVDDGIVFAYPDRDQYFQKFKTFYRKDSMSGSRYSARQVYSTLKKLGAEWVKVEVCGINSAQMDFKHKRLLFESWFSFMPNDFKQIVASQPDNREAKKIYEWINEYYDDLEEQFFDDDFFFNSGYMIFSAKFPE